MSKYSKYSIFQSGNRGGKTSKILEDLRKSFDWEQIRKELEQEEREERKRKEAQQMQITYYPTSSHTYTISNAHTFSSNYSSVWYELRDGRLQEVAGPTAQKEPDEEYEDVIFDE